MNKHTQSNHDSTFTFSTRLLLLIMLATLLRSCGSVLQAPMPSQPKTESTLSEYLPATQEISLIPTIKMPTEIPTITQTSEVIGLFSEMQNFKSLLESMEHVDGIILAPEQVFLDFFNETIPTDMNSRITENNEHAEIGQFESFIIPDRGTFAYVQLILMGGFTNDDGAYLLLGTEDKITGDRLILPVQFTFGYGEVYSTVQVQKDGSQVKKLSPEFKNSNPLDAQGLLDIAQENLGKVVVVQIVLDYKYEIITDENRKLSIEKYDWVERQKSNNILINNPSTLDIYDLKKSPTSQRIVF